VWILVKGLDLLRKKFSSVVPKIVPKTATIDFKEVYVVKGINYWLKD